MSQPESKSRPAANGGREKRLRVWAEAVLAAEKPDVDRGHDGRAKISQRVAVEAAEELLALLDSLDALERAYAQACTNLATIRPSGIEGAAIGDDAERYHDALLAGWGGIEGWDDRHPADG